MSGRVATCVVIFIFMSCISAEAAIKFLYPAPMSLVKRADYLILKMNNLEITGVRVTINGIASEVMLIESPEYRKAFQDLIILRPVWDPGKNEIIVDGFNGEKKIETTATEIFFSTKKIAADISLKYKNNAVHVPEIEKVCSPCHEMNPTSAQLDNSMDKKNPCYNCHKQLANTSFVHGPAGTFSCAYCHQLKGTPKYAVINRDAVLCNECHAEKTTELKKRKFLHGPVEAGMCEICHDAHGSAFPSQLHQSINDTCLSCHETVATGAHVVRITGGGGHPIKDKPDPSKPGSGRDLSCVSCHNPHGGDVRYFFPNNLGDRMQLCQMCHNK